MSAWRHADVCSLRVLASLPLAPLFIRGDGYFCSVATLVPLGRLAAMLAAGFGFRCFVARFGKCIGLVVSMYVLSVSDDTGRTSGCILCYCALNRFL